jgi:alpha-1,6-mannosyltransferase
MNVIDRSPEAATRMSAVDPRSRVPDQREVISGRLGHAGLIMILGSGSVLCVAASKTNALLPQSIRPDAVGSLAGAFSRVGFYLPAGGLIVALTLMLVGYALVVHNADRVSPRLALATVVSLVAVVLLAPPLVSTDLFSYQEYARIFFGLHLNPYTHSSQVLALDPLYPYIGATWINTPTVYGPLFTLLSGVFADTSSTAAIAFSAYAYKTIAALSCLGIVWMMWRAARLRGLNPVRGTVLFGLNPLVVFYGVGGGHNDLLMMAFSTAAIWALLSGRQRSSGALCVAGAAIKLTGGIFLLFALAQNSRPRAGIRRHRVLLGGAVATAVTLQISLAVFGNGTTNMIHTLSAVQGEGGWQSVPGFLCTALHCAGARHLVTTLFGVAFLLICSNLLWRVWRDGLDWLEAAAWGTFWLLVTTSSIQPWYMSWMLVPAALCASRKLVTAAVWFSGWVMLTQMAFCLPHSPTILGFRT